MTLEEVEARVAKIRAIAYDPEQAHAAEDDLWEDVLEVIAESWDVDYVGNVAVLAQAALKTREIKFERWYS